MANWKDVAYNQKIATATGSFDHDGFRLSFSVNDKLEILKESDGWYYGRLLDTPKNVGIFPKTHVKVDGALDARDNPKGDVVFRKSNTLPKNNKINLNQEYLRSKGFFNEALTREITRESKIMLLDNTLDETYQFENELEVPSLDETEANSHLVNSSQQSESNNCLLSPESNTTSYLVPVKNVKTIISMYDSLENAAIIPPKSNHIPIMNLKIIIESIEPLPEDLRLYANLFLSNQDEYLNETAILSDPSNGKQIIFCDVPDLITKQSNSTTRLKLMLYGVRYIRIRGNEYVKKLHSGYAFDLEDTIVKLKQSPNTSITNEEYLLICEKDKEPVAPIKNLIILGEKSPTDPRKRLFYVSLSNEPDELPLIVRFNVEIFESTYNEVFRKYSRQSVLSRKLTLSDVKKPDDVRNEFYVYVNDGKFKKRDNYEFVANLVKFVQENGDIVEKEISFDDEDNLYAELGEPFKYNSLMYTNQKNPEWYEVIKIPIQKQRNPIKTTYLRFLVRTHDSNGVKLYGRCYVKLMNEDGSAVNDQSLLYLIVDKIEQTDSEQTFRNPSTPNLNQFTEEPSQKEYIRIKLSLVSTKLMQNQIMPKFYLTSKKENANILNTKTLLTSLKQLTELKNDKPIEIMKDCEHLVQSLIELLVDIQYRYDNSSFSISPFFQKEHEELQNESFSVLIAVFETIDRKFPHYSTILHGLLDNSKIVAVHAPVLRLFIANLSWLYETFNIFISHNSLRDRLDFIRNDNLNEKINMMASIEYIFQIALKSFENIKHDDSVQLNQVFSDIDYIFKKFAQLFNFSLSQSEIELMLRDVGSSEDSSYIHSTWLHLIQLQTFIIKYTPCLLKLLLKAKKFTPKDIARYYTSIIGSIKSNMPILRIFSTVEQNTKFFSQLINSALLTVSDSQFIVIEAVSNFFASKIFFDLQQDATKPEEYVTVGKLVAELMNILEQKNSVDIREEMKLISTELLPILMFIFKKPNNHIYKKTYGACILSILNKMDKNDFLLDICPINGTKSLLEEVLEISKYLLFDEVFPIDWLEFLCNNDRVILNVFKHISEHISNQYRSDFNLDNKKVFQDFFDAIVMLITRNDNNNMRLEAVVVLRNLWNILSFDKKFSLTSDTSVDILKLFLKVALIGVEEITVNMLAVIFDMICAEFKTVGQNAFTFRILTIPNRLVILLDDCINSGYGSEQFCQIFEDMSTRDIEREFTDNSDYTKYIQDSIALMRLLFEYRNLSHDEIKSFYISEILAIYGSQKMNHLDLYLKYVRCLFEIHERNQNNICKAYTTLLHEDKLNWSNDFIEENSCLKHFRHLNVLKQNELKECLLIDSITFFDMGKAWDIAYHYLKIIRRQLEEEHKYNQLISIMTSSELRLCKNLSENKTVQFNYYLVGFYGNDFPKLLQNRRFVFISILDQASFENELKSLFTEASIIQPLEFSNIKPTDLNMQVQSIEVIKGKPVDQLKKATENSTNVFTKRPSKHKEFEFEVTNSTRRNGDFLTYHGTSKLVKITKSLPNIINFYPIVLETSTPILPIEYAINGIKNLNKVIEENFDQIVANPLIIETDSNWFGNLNNIVGTGEDNALARYAVFFNSNYVNENRDIKHLIDELKDRIEKLLNLTDTYLTWCEQKGISDAFARGCHAHIPILKEKLLIKKWLFDCTRNEASRLLEYFSNDVGVYIIRKSERDNGVEYSLSVLYYNKYSDRKTFHFRIFQTNTDEYYIQDGIQFKSLDELVIYYEKNAFNGGCILKKAFPKHDYLGRMHIYKKNDIWEEDNENIEFVGEPWYNISNGLIYAGKLEKKYDVLVKKFRLENLTARNYELTINELKREMEIMKTLRSDHIVKLWAVCSIKQPFLIVSEYMVNGRLSTYLRKNKYRLSLETLIDMATQIAHAMWYIEGKNYVHGDLASRNVFVGENNLVKIGDFTYAREINTPYRVKKLPDKWTAPEILLANPEEQHRFYTIKSDVWSFGILLYELITFGAAPYIDLNLEQVKGRLKHNQYRISISECNFNSVTVYSDDYYSRTESEYNENTNECPKEFYAKMLECWSEEPQNRPLFGTLHNYFKSYFEKLQSPSSVQSYSNSPFMINTNKKDSIHF